MRRQPLPPKPRPPLGGLGVLPEDGTAAPPAAPGLMPAFAGARCCDAAGAAPALVTPGGDGLPALGDDPQTALTALPWSDFFDERRDLRVPGRGTFRVHCARGRLPHAGGYRQPVDKATTIVLLVHGGGYTSLTWAPMARELAARATPRTVVAAVDLRAHGGTLLDCQRSHRDQPSDLSADALAGDVRSVGGALLAEAAEGARLVLVGHSMGGAAAVRAAPAFDGDGSGPSSSSLAGLVVIDVVEGTAMASLRHMRAVLDSVPSAFASEEDAVRWALASKACRSVEAARVSVPARLRPEGEACEGATPARDRSDESARSAANAQSLPPRRLVWRTDLGATEPHWEGWYRGLSDAFLRVRAPKVLVLAGADRLDRALTMASMQGRYQTVLLPGAGHAVHEDAADKVAGVLAGFLERYRLG
eukprot:PRCOL_00002994-RA